MYKTVRRFNVTFRKRIADTGDKQFIHLQVGKAYENEEGHIDLIVNSVPLNWDGKLRLWHDKNNLDDDVIEDET
jgi:hypothetical protein